jgi:hypothetical protein
MSETIPSGFQSFSDRTVQYHSHMVALFSGIVIGFLTNYIVTFMVPLPYYYGLGISVMLLVFSAYLFLLYSPDASIGEAHEVVPEALHQFLHSNFDKLLTYIKLDWEGYAFHKKTASAIGWQSPIMGVVVRTKQISSHQGDISLEYPFLRVLRCKFKITIFVTTLSKVPEYRKVVVTIQVNTLGRIHPKSNLLLRTLGIRLNHAITNPQIVYPNMPEQEWHAILKEIRPSVWEAFVNTTKKQ